VHARAFCLRARARARARIRLCARCARAILRSCVPVRARESSPWFRFGPKPHMQAAMRLVMTPSSAAFSRATSMLVSAASP
jgi:hypothetical protein